jgi:hypothetical protein
VKRAVWMLALLVLGTGCEGFDHLDMVLRSAPPDGAVLHSDEIRIHEGIAVGFAARPMEDEHDMMDEETVVRLETGNPGIFQVAPAPREDDDDEAPYEFVIWGVAAGESVLGVFIDGDFETEIPVFVDEQ